VGPSARRAVAQRRRQLALEQVEEAVLIRTDLDEDHVIVARPMKRSIASRWRSSDGPQLTDLATTSGVTCSLAAAKSSVSGNSACTGQPVTAQRK
jgi:hypothetical protein